MGDLLDLVAAEAELRARLLEFRLACGRGLVTHLLHLGLELRRLLAVLHRLLFQASDLQAQYLNLARGLK